MKNNNAAALGLGLIIGLVIGLGPHWRGRLCDQGAGAIHEQGARAAPPTRTRPKRKKNKDWDPNAPLYGKNPARPAPAASGAVCARTPAPQRPRRVGARRAGATCRPATGQAGSQARRHGRPAGRSGQGQVSRQPRQIRFYFMQAGAYRTPEDAEAQRAKLSLIGLEAR
jgi:cell division protein FtsN